MIRHSMGYMNVPLKIAGLASGVAFGQLGYTHCSIEDVSIINSVPNIAIFSLADPSLYQSLSPSIINTSNPAYIRVTGEPGLTPRSFSLFPNLHTYTLYSEALMMSLSWLLVPALLLLYESLSLVSGISLSKRLFFTL